MTSCAHPYHSHARIKPLRQAHNLLCTKSRHYHNWHHNRQHKKVHIAQQFAPIAIITDFTA